MIKGRILPLWQIITGRNSENLNEVFVSLKNIVFKFDYFNPRSLQPSREDELLSSYITQEVFDKDDQKYGKLNRIEEYNSEGLGSAIIRKLKGKEEPLESLTHEHLLAERLIKPFQNIVLHGHTGSGKTCKMEYIWLRYLKKLDHCSEPCDIKKRLRFRIDIDECGCMTPTELYRTIFNSTTQEAKQNLGDSFSMIYQNFINALFEMGASGNPPSYFASLLARGLTMDSPPAFSVLFDHCNDEGERRDLTRFALHFLGWLRNNYYKNNHSCVSVLLDNIDGSPGKVQDSIVYLLEHTQPEHDALLICACRDETLRRWKSQGTVLDCIEHHGINASTVIIKRLKDFLEKHPADDDLSDLLENTARTPQDFLTNLGHITERLSDGHFQRLLNDYFGNHIRSALIFAKGTVDIAARLSTEELRKTAMEKISPYGLERLLYRPWGLKTPTNFIINVIGASRKINRRLSFLRILNYLYPEPDYAMTIRDVQEHMSMFGYTPGDTCDITNAMLRSRLILVATQDPYDIGTFDDSKNEQLRVTEVGRGLLMHYNEYSYVSAVMYFSYCMEDRYKDVRTQDPDLDAFSTLQILRVFLCETAEIEFAELDQVQSQNRIDEYKKTYAEKTISYELYNNIIKSTIRIGFAEKAKKGEVHNRILDLINYIVYQDFYKLTEGMTSYNLRPDPIIDPEYNKLINQLGEHFISLETKK